MPKVKRVLGHVRVENAKGLRKCRRNKGHAITKGCACLVIENGAMAGERSYCVTCAAEILTRAASDLHGMREMLGLA